MDIITPDVVTTPPTLVSSHGKAWGLPLSTLREKLHWPPVDPTISAWLVERPDAHPFWHSYLVFAIHLRPVDGMPPAQIRKPGASYEFFLFAADPEFQREPIVKGEAAPRRLDPGNFVAQFKAASDVAARLYISNLVIWPLITGVLNPDTDARSQWIAQFGSDGMKEFSFNTGLLQ